MFWNVQDKQFICLIWFGSRKISRIFVFVIWAFFNILLASLLQHDDISVVGVSHDLVHSTLVVRHADVYQHRYKPRDRLYIRKHECI